MQHEPDGDEYLSGYGYLDLHRRLSPNDGLGVAELAQEGALRPTGGPRDFYESFPQVLVAVGDASELDREHRGSPRSRYGGYSAFASSADFLKEM